MSSSRTIKSVTCPDQPVADFCFNSFQKRPGQALQSVSDGLMPFPMTQHMCVIKLFGDIVDDPNCCCL